MVLFGYADFDRPIAFDVGRLFYPFGGGPFILAPHRCGVANLDDGRMNFLLDLIRPALPFPGDDAYANLEMRFNADYASDEALAYLRKQDPQAVLSRSVLTDWEFRIAPGAATLNVPHELLNPIQLASNNLGSARIVMRLSIESGLIIDTLLQEGDIPVYAVAEAQMQGISPRVGAVVRFKTSELLAALLDLTSADDTVPWQSLVHFFSRDLAELPMKVSGQIEPSQSIAFGETLADRIIARFGSYVTSSNDDFEPLVKLKRIDKLGESEIKWSLSQPFLASRRIIMHFDFLSDVRRRVQDFGIDSFVRRHAASPLPSFGQSNLTAFCNLPLERVGVVALGATLTFPPNPPDRPHSKSETVLFEPPEDIVQTRVQLAPGESLQYEYSTFVVISDEHGVREIRNPAAPYVGSPLRLSPDAFPIDFALVEVTRELAALASIDGVCQYERDGQEYQIPFALDSGRFSVSVALPKNSHSVSLQCTAISRDSGAVLRVGPFESLKVRLDVSSFLEYGWHEVEFECIFDGKTSVYAIDILPVGLDETFENLTILAFTPDQPKRRFGWFAQSPFRPGFQYRPHRDDSALGSWRHVPFPVEQFVITPERSEIQAASEAVAVSETAMLQSRFVGTRATSKPEGARAIRLPKGSPISPQAEPTDLLIYRDPADPARKFYIPRYWVDTQTVSGQQRYRIAMGQQGVTSTLTIHLVKGPAESIERQTRDAEEFPHDIAIHLEFLQAPPFTARKILPFQEITRHQANVTAIMTFASLQERDEVFRALTESVRDARLIVKRIVDVALPQSPSSIIDVRGIKHLTSNMLFSPISFEVERQAATLLPGAGNIRFRPDRILDPVLIDRIRVNPSLPKPTLAFVGRETRTVRGKQFTQANLSVTNWEAFSSDFFKPSPDLPPCGLNKNASRTWVDIHDAETDARLYGFCALSSPKTLTKLWFSVPAPKELPKRVYVQLRDRRTKVVQKSNAVETREPKPSKPVYREVRRELDHTVEPAPFAFLQSLHGYIFQGIIPGDEGGGLIPFRLRWKNTFHTYLQDAARPHVVYFFPDHFRIARRREAPFTPFITVRVVSRDGLADVDVVFDYIVAPHTEPRRLKETRAGLLADPRFGASDVEFLPFVTNDVRFFIDRPTQLGSVREERSDVSIVLQGSLKDSIVMKLPDFQIVFDAMHRDTASLFLGHVDIDVPRENTEVIPFIARMEELEGDLFLYTATPQADGRVRVSLTNAIESPIRINFLEASIGRGEQVVNASIEGPVFPIESLAPGEGVEMTVIPQTPLVGSGTPEVTFSLEGVTVLPDPETIWDSILDRSTIEFFRTITVKAISSLFGPISGRENDQVAVILVGFEGGGTAELTASQLEAQVRIDYPIDDVILRESIDTDYRYTVTVIRVDGRQERDLESRQGSTDLLFVSIKK